MVQLSAELVKRIWSKADRSGGLDSCWIWQGMRDRDGYGRIRATELGIKNACAHRLAYMASIGDIPKGLVLAHSCDNPPCINPRHLSAVTQTQNMQEAVQRQRLKPSGPKLSKEARKQMAKDYGTLNFYQLKDKYGVHYSTVKKVIRNQPHR